MTRCVANVCFPPISAADRAESAFDPLRTLAADAISQRMTANDNDWSFLSDTVVRVEKTEGRTPPSDKYHITITECADGTCYANGLGCVDGNEALYVSTVESDTSLTSGLKAAVAWAEVHNVDVIYIELEAGGSLD